ncbi:MAG: hypothetical protein ACOH1R_11405 [Luteimonas sp.]
MILRTFGLIVLLSAAVLARAQMPPPAQAAPSAEELAQMQAVQAASQSYYTRAASQLAASGQPRELAFAATLRQFASLSALQAAQPAGDVPSRASAGDPRIGKWQALASARAGKDVLANVLLMGAGSASDAAVRRQAAARWQRVEPDNLAPLLFTDMPVEALLAAARTRARFDLHFYDQARWMQAALLAHPPTAGERQVLLGGEPGASMEELSMVTSLVLLGAGAIAMPSLQPLTEACQGNALASIATRRDACRHVAALMAETSDTNLGVSIGLALQERLANTQGEHAAVDATRRRFDWQMLQWGRVAASQPRDGAAQFAEWLRDPAVDSEHAMVERVLRAAGVPLDPPAGWQAPQRGR